MSDFKLICLEPSPGASPAGWLLAWHHTRGTTTCHHCEKNWESGISLPFCGNADMIDITDIQVPRRLRTLLLPIRVRVSLASSTHVPSNPQQTLTSAHPASRKCGWGLFAANFFLFPAQASLHPHLSVLATVHGRRAAVPPSLNANVSIIIIIVIIITMLIRACQDSNDHLSG